MSRHHEAEKAVGEEMAHQSSTRKQRAGPSRQARLRHPPGTQTADSSHSTIAELPTAREKQQQQQSRGNLASKSTPRSAVQKLTRRSSNDACAGRSSSGSDRNSASAAARRGKELITADEKRRLTEEVMKKVQEADLLIQQLNELGVGEDISQEELQCYYQQLPREPPRVDTFLELDDEEEISRLQARHALCRIKYYKVTQEQGRKDDAELEEEYYHVRRVKEKLKCFVEHETELEGDHILHRLDKEGLLAYIEEDYTLDWSFQYRTVATLDDYQRLVPENGGGCEYVHWDDYREYFHKYEIELEYLDFWEELSKKLKWMEDYIHFGWPTLKWRRICSRGESQAIKIATGFSNITVRLAHAAYYECIDDMNMEYCWYKELDGVYFEIWKRVTKLKKSFREALDEVYKLDMFPLRQHVMKYALESDGLEFEREFHNCTEDITEEVTEEKAQDLIADAITKLRTRPKFYAQYIKKKIEIARAIGIIPQV
ncbi:unnamed protein product [Urochloa decumbens]|uniref:Uncharacterized protein n=1 Tax=Urochloa decumbens TaxID=240449 RepID=A0ABC8W624_9POAL